MPAVVRQYRFRTILVAAAGDDTPLKEETTIINPNLITCVPRELKRSPEALFFVYSRYLSTKEMRGGHNRGRRALRCVTAVSLCFHQ